METGKPEEWHIATGPDGSQDWPGTDDQQDDPWYEGDPDDDPWGEPGAEHQLYGPGPGGKRGLTGSPGLLTAAVAIAAAAAGAAIGLAFVRLPVSHASSSSPSPPTSSSSAPRPAFGGGGLQISMVGTVLAVSAHSITIGGAGPSVTAAITSETRFTGRVTRTGSIKVGSEVAADISGSGSSLTVTTIQDPAAQ